MRKRRLLRKQRKAAIIDMDDFLVTYAAEVLGINHPNLSMTVYNAASGNLKGLDHLFHDNGFGRTQKFSDIADGFVNDCYQITGPRAHQIGQNLCTTAIKYLGAHAHSFDHWKKA